MTERLLLRPKETAATLGLHLSTVYEMLNEKSRYFDPEFPKPISLGGRARFFVAVELHQYIARKAARRDQPKAELQRAA